MTFSDYFSFLHTHAREIKQLLEILHRSPRNPRAGFFGTISSIIAAITAAAAPVITTAAATAAPVIASVATTVGAAVLASGASILVEKALP